jgi:hypothetical protein
MLSLKLGISALYASSRIMQIKAKRILYEIFECISFAYVFLMSLASASRFRFSIELYMIANKLNRKPPRIEIAAIKLVI